MKILMVFGTRPEAIKMAPLIKHFENNLNFEIITCVTGQHREMLDQVLNLFDIKPDFDLNIMKSGQTLVHITQAVLEGVTDILEQATPDMVMVHGDVTTGVAASLAAFYKKIPVGHIEAGLRTGNIYSPFPEEMNRKLISNLTTYHFAPTEMSKANLKNENIDLNKIIVTGNTVIDALLYIKEKIFSDSEILSSLKQKFSFLDPNKRIILVTGHRRENFDGGLENTCNALKEIVKRDDVQIVYPVHLNPQVKNITDKILKSVNSVFLVDPLEYLQFVYLMSISHIIVTDSGGIQEEAPSLGKPVLVTRDTTERPEAIEAGTVLLVGKESSTLIKELNQLLDDKEKYNRMSQSINPYGDGKACERIKKYLMESVEYVKKSN